MQTTTEKQMNDKMESLRESMEKRISESKEVFKREVAKAVKEMQHALDLEVGIVCSRMDQIETKMNEKKSKGKQFDPVVSLVIVGLSQAEGEDVEAKVKTLLGWNGL